MTAKTANPEIIKIIRILRRKSNETGATIWHAVAEKLGKSKHGRLSVNVSRVNRYSSDGETIVVPGKVLGAGNLDHRISVAAFNFSKQAKEKIERAGGECLTIQALIQRNPKGSGVKIIG